MREISKEEADRLRFAGLRGFWAAWANPPIVHESQYVVCVNDRWFDMDPGTITIKFEGLVKLPNSKVKQAHSVNISDEQLIALIHKSSLGGQVDLGAGIPTFHTDSLKPQG